MKRKYEKPYLAVESFQLDAAIAASCSSVKKVAINHQYESCTLADEFPGEQMFGDACRLRVREDVCYQAMQDGAFLES